MLIVGFTYASLFSGIGGFETALNELGGTCVLASEIDKHANKAYGIIYGESTVGDIMKVAADSVPDHDLLVGGFPCQAFSVAGKQLGFEDTRGTLFFEIARIARVKKPKMLLLENVKGLVSHDKGRTLDTIIQTLHDVGYAVDFKVLNSKYFGVPQNRERIFIVAIRDMPPEPWAISKKRDVVAKAKERIYALGVRTFNFTWPDNGEVTSCIRDILEDSVDEKYYLSEEKTAKLVAQLDERITEPTILDTKPKDAFRLYPSECPTLQANDYKEPKQLIEPVEAEMQMVGLLDIKGNESIRRVDSAEGISPTLTTMGGGHREPKIAVESPQQFSLEGEGVSYCLDANYAKGTSPGDIGKGRRTHLIEEIRPVLTPDRGEKRQDGRRFKEHGEPSFTLTAQDRHGIAIGCYPRYHIRKLTPLECFRLQGFPDEYYHALKSAGISDSQLYKMAGNAVTVYVISAIGRRLLPYITRELKEAA